MPASHHSLSLTPAAGSRLPGAAFCCGGWHCHHCHFVPKHQPHVFHPAGSHRPRFVWHGLQQAQVEQSAAQLFIVWDTRYSAQAEGIVIAQKPTAGSTVKQGQKLILSVSKGPNTITVPDLKSQNRSDAIQTLRDAGFTVSVDYIRNDPTLQADTVILQSPAAGTALEAGDCITLTVARAVPDPFRQVPSLLGMSSPKRAAALPLWSCCPL